MGQLVISAILNIQPYFGKLIIAVISNMEPRGKSQEQGELGYYNSNTYQSYLLLGVYFVSATVVSSLLTLAHLPLQLFKAALEFRF